MARHALHPVLHRPRGRGAPSVAASRPAVDAPDIQPVATRGGHGQVFLGHRRRSRSVDDSERPTGARLPAGGSGALGARPGGATSLSCCPARRRCRASTRWRSCSSTRRPRGSSRTTKGLEEEVERGVRIPVGAGFAGRIVAERAPISSTTSITPTSSTRSCGRRASSLLGVPLLVEGRVDRRAARRHAHAARVRRRGRGVLQLAADRAAPAIERARLYEELEHEHRGDDAAAQPAARRLPELVGLGIAARYLPGARTRSAATGTT